MLWSTMLATQATMQISMMAIKCPFGDPMALTHLPLDKMAAILADDNFKCIYMNENDKILIRISLKIVARS